jgi:4-amino-4-deoxy-L-arabinose transferase-like glycosyltransferase
VIKGKNDAGSERALFRVIKFSSAFGLGAMAAILYSVKRVTPDLEYEVSFGSGVCFALAVAVSWAFWRVVFGKQNDLNQGWSRNRRRRFIALSLFLSAATAVPFVYALKDVAWDEASEVAQGTAIAVLVLGMLGFVFWRLTRYLNADSKREEDNDGSSEPH